MRLIERTRVDVSDDDDVNVKLVLSHCLQKREESEGGRKGESAKLKRGENSFPSSRSPARRHDSETPPPVKHREAAREDPQEQCSRGPETNSREEGRNREGGVRWETLPPPVPLALPHPPQRFAEGKFEQVA